MNPAGGAPGAEPSTLTLPLALQRAAIAYQRGDWSEAERLCRLILDARADYFDALLLLGAIVAQTRRTLEAVELLSRAVAVNSNSAEAYSNLGNALADLKRDEEALESYQRAIVLKPASADLYINRGNLLAGLKRYAAALESFEQAIALKPDHAEAHSNRGGALNCLMRHEAALESYERAIALKPDFTEAYYNRGNSLSALNCHSAALESYDRAIALAPSYVEAYNNRGVALANLKRYEAALESYERAITLNPEYAEGFDNRGVAFAELERHEEALESYDRAIALKPAYAKAYFNRGVALAELKRHEAALDSYEKAIAHKSDYAEAYCNRGVLLAELNRHVEALESYERAIVLKPDYAEAHNNRGVALVALKQYEAALESYGLAMTLGPDHAETYNNRGIAFTHLKRLEEATQSFESALRLKPDFQFLYGTWLHTKMKMCDWSDLETHFSHLVKRIERDEKASPLFPILAIPSTLELRRRAAQIWVQARHPACNTPPASARRPHHDKIRIAYVSADFREHPVSHLMVEVFEQHNSDKFEWIAISLQPHDESPISHRVRSAFAQFIDVSRMSDLEVAHLMRGLEVDIAVDLMGFTGDARTGIFAYRPAPIQVNYLGDAGTMGVSYMDYVLADQIVIPESHRSFYTEKIAYMPHTYLPRDSTCKSGNIPLARSAAGLPPSGFVFCSFNSPFKLNPGFFAIWMRLLEKILDSVLWLSDVSDIAKRNLVREAQRRGVAPERLIFARRTERVEDHLARLTLADLFLDTLPLNACTTASDALWAGVPVLTCMGDTFPGRVAASLLNAMGLHKLIAETPELYEKLAIELAANPDKLAEIRQKLINNRVATPVFDTRLFARHVEAAYTMMYERYIAGLPLDHIYVPA